MEIHFHLKQNWKSARISKTVVKPKAHIAPHTIIVRDFNSLLYWLVLCQLDTVGVITEKGASVEEMPP